MSKADRDRRYRETVRHLETHTLAGVLTRQLPSEVAGLEVVDSVTLQVARWKAAQRPAPADYRKTYELERVPVVPDDFTELSRPRKGCCAICGRKLSRDWMVACLRHGLSEGATA